MQVKQDWEKLAINSHYLTATAIQRLLQDGQTLAAIDGLNALVAAMGRSERQAVKSQLIRLMSHVIKWKYQPERRSTSWAITINSARNEIEASQEEMPSLNQSFIEFLWDKCLIKAKKEAELEMGKKANITSLSWLEVFEEEYTVWDFKD